MNVIEKLKDVSVLLKSAGIENPAKEAEILITEALQITKSQLYTNILEISDKVSHRIDLLVNRRLQGEPIQYIIGYVEFYGLKIHVGKGVLIPRPETELVVEETIKAVSSVECRLSDKKNRKFKIQNSKFKNENSKMKILDLCTGSGCIAIALAKNLKQAFVYGVDKSEAAIGYARENAILNKVSNISFIVGDLFEPVRDIKFDFIVSNPPYIKKDEIQNLQREIRDYEPLNALDGGEDGLDFYRRVISESPYFLKKGGMLILEAGFNQAEEIKKLAKSSGYKEIKFFKDYAGIERVFIGRII